MVKQRLDQLLVAKKMVATRSQAESWIRLGKVLVNGRVITKPGYFTASDAEIELKAEHQYVSRAGLKLASVAQLVGLDFDGKIVLDVGSSTGGFTDYALRHGAKKVIAIDVGTQQLHPTLRDNPRVELHEQTDIRHVLPAGEGQTANVQLSEIPAIVLIDVSFISLREILPHLTTLVNGQTQVVAMFKPQFEAGDNTKHKGVIKNDTMRRRILKDFEQWIKHYFMVIDKADSEVAGARGNRERFYVLRKAMKI